MNSLFGKAEFGFARVNWQLGIHEIPISVLNNLSLKRCSALQRTRMPKRAKVLLEM